MKCSVCRADADARKRWGCDEESEQTGLEFECWECEEHPGEDRSCATCGRTGVVRLKRCPNAVLDMEAGLIVQAVCRLQVGILPAAGGWCDQAAAFADAADLVGRQQQRYHERRIEEAKRRR